jgi:hypothetical protein
MLFLLEIAYIDAGFIVIKKAVRESIGGVS